MTTTQTDQLVEEYRRRHPGSATLHRAATGFFAAKGATHFARIRAPFRPYITHAQGSHKWDVDGNEYIDYVMGHGALVLGHGHPAVVEAVQQQAGRGIHFGDNHGLEVEWAALIRGMMPAAERIEFCACGQEANLLGFRIGRVLTGRRKILRFLSHYHGWADELAGPAAPGSVADQVTLIEPNNLEILEKTLSSREYAVMLVEGGGGYLAGRTIAPPEFYRALPDLARKYGTLLMLDEVVTGFREAPGGWQTVVGITPDLTSIGKAVSAGIPAGALVGRAECMVPLDPDNERSQTVVHGGTWNALPLTAAAGIAACKIYRDGAPHRTMLELSAQLTSQANEVLQRHGVSGRIYGRSVVHIYLGPVDESGRPIGVLEHGKSRLAPRLDLHLLQRGVSSMIGEAFVLSAAHTPTDIEKTIAALDQSIQAMQEEGTLDQ